jgi:cytochrome c oxidase assembly factor CtaG
LFGDPCIGFGKATEVLSAWGGEILGTRGAWAARLPVDGPGALFSSWTWDPLVLGAILLASGVYGLGRRRRRRRGGVGPAVRFGAGVLVWAVAASPPFERLADALLWGHMTQHLLLTLVAAPLLAGGAFGRVALAALPAGPRARIGRWLAAPRGRAAADVLLHPLVAAGLHAGALWLWHQPVAYEAALDSRPLHALEHASFLGTAALFWASVLRARRRRRLVLWGVLGLFLNGVASAVLGVLLTVAPTLWYPSYAATFHAGGLTPLEDQQLAGLLMWVPGQVLYLVMTLVLCARWLERPGAEAPICAPPFGPPAEGIR